MESRACTCVYIYICIIGVEHICQRSFVSLVHIYIYVIKSKNPRLYFFIIRVDRFNTFEKQIQIHIYS